MSYQDMSQKQCQKYPENFLEQMNSCSNTLKQRPKYPENLLRQKTLRQAKEETLKDKPRSYFLTGEWKQAALRAIKAVEEETQKKVAKQPPRSDATSDDPAPQPEDTQAVVPYASS